MSQTSIEIHGLNGVLDMLKSLPPDVVSKRGGPVKLALAKGRALPARQVQGKPAPRDRARPDHALHRRTGEARHRQPRQGALQRQGRALPVRVKKRDYINADGVRTNPLMTANLLEYGSSHQPATPFPTHGRAER